MRKVDPSRSPTLEDVAVLAGVSRATVSRVINNTRNVDAHIHDVVWRAVDETGYVPNRAARSLVTRRCDTIVLVISDPDGHTDDDPFLSRPLADPFFGRVVGGTMSVVRARGVQLALQVVGEIGQTTFVRELRQGRADGAIVVAPHPKDALPERLVDAGVPVVLVGRPVQPLPLSFVDLANDTGARLAAEHLVARGCERIGLICGPVDAPASHDRVTGFRQHLARQGTAYVPSFVGTFTRDSGDAAVRQLIREHPDIDGVFAANDLMAQGAITALWDLGRRVPDDVAVVGFDDSSAALACRPQLTTVRQPLEDMAAESARLLLERIEDPDLEPVSVIFEPTLVLRGSA